MGDGDDVREGWSRYPGLDEADSHPARTYLNDAEETLDKRAGSAPVVGLGAICGPRERQPGEADDRLSQSFWVGEFALLSDGTRVVLHDSRGFTLGIRGPAAREALREEQLTETVRTVVFSDDGVRHWSWLSDLARVRGIDASPESLQHLPYTVLLSDGARELLS